MLKQQARPGFIFRQGIKKEHVDCCHVDVDGDNLSSNISIAGGIE